MTLEDEITFFIQARQKAKDANTEKNFQNRFNTLFLEGQVSEKGYKILNEIFGYNKKAPTIPATVPKIPKASVVEATYSSDPCGRGGYGARSGGC